MGKFLKEAMKQAEKELKDKLREDIRQKMEDHMRNSGISKRFGGIRIHILDVFIENKIYRYKISIYDIE